MRFPCAVALLLVLHSALRVAAQNPACLLNCINGNCYTNGNSFACVCSAGYGGSLCEEAVASVTVCGASSVLPYCANGGRCPANASSTCDCGGLTPPFGGTVYRGVFCEFAATLCPNSLVWCAHGGTCNPLGNSCNCPAGWGDTDCNQLIASSTPPPSATSSRRGTVAVPTWVAAPIILGVVLLCCAVTGLGVLIARERKGRPVFTRLVSTEPLTLTRAQSLSRRAAADVKEDATYTGVVSMLPSDDAA